MTADLVTFTEKILNGKLHFLCSHQVLNWFLSVGLNHWFSHYTKWTKTEYGIFLIDIFSYSEWIRRCFLYISVFSLTTIKYGPEKNYVFGQFQCSVTNTSQKWSFLLRISSKNVSKSAVSCGFGHIYWRNPSRKTSFFCSVWWSFETVIRT